MAQNKDNIESITVEEAGRSGGTTTRDRYGSEFYSEIGRKGGQARAKSQKNKKRARKANQAARDKE
ncbi:stress-induced protein, KGG, repeat-containing protein [Candidatus Microgenomates bacterium]|jgi:hypothetical protein|nr:MAG: stress-induced protein, KGG, repeat-containing protein [Candidatus Microgenomates bacterium]